MSILGAGVVEPVCMHVGPRVMDVTMKLCQQKLSFLFSVWVVIQLYLITSSSNWCFIGKIWPRASTHFKVNRAEPVQIIHFFCRLFVILTVNINLLCKSFNDLF